MAPPTGPRALTLAANTRGRGNGRGGGIQKRRAAPGTRIDRDGDIAMDAPVRGGGSSRGRKSHPPSRGNARTTAQNLKAYGTDAFTVEPGRRGVSINSSKARFAHTTVLTVTGLDLTDGGKGLTALLSFLERKASKNQSKTITIIKVCSNT